MAHTPTIHAGTPAGDDRAGVRPTVSSYLTEVPVTAGILHATAELLELLGEFFTDTDRRCATHWADSSTAANPTKTPATPSSKQPSCYTT